MVRIYSQGDLNGGCFLYSIANAYKALSNKEITPNKWSKALNSVFYLEDFWDGLKGTGRYNDNPVLFETVINSMLREFSSKFSFKTKHVNCSDIDEIKNLITKKSVAIFCYADSKVNHWTCAVDVSDDKSKIYVADSSCNNEHNTTERYQRWHNEALPKEDEVEIMNVSVFKITIE